MSGIARHASAPIGAPAARVKAARAAPASNRERGRACVRMPIAAARAPASVVKVGTWSVQRCAANRVAVLDRRALFLDGVDDERDLVVDHHVDDVRPAFGDLVDRRHRHARRARAPPPCRASRPAEAELGQHARDLDRARLVGVAHADEHLARSAAASRRRRAALLTNASANVSPTPITSPVDFISGPRIVSTPGNLMNGNTASFTEKYGGTISPRDALLAQRLCRPCSARRSSPAAAGRLRHEGHGARGARVHFEHVHDSPSSCDRELHVHQADDSSSMRHRDRLAAQLVLESRATASTAAASTPSRPSARRPARCAP